MKQGIELIADERREQIEKHGWSLDHDKYYSKGQLIQAAIFCKEQAENKLSGSTVESVKWPEGWNVYFEHKVRSKTPIQQLVVCGAFYMAENDRTGTKRYQKRINMIAKKIDAIQYNYVSRNRKKQDGTLIEKRILNNTTLFFEGYSEAFERSKQIHSYVYPCFEDKETTIRGHKHTELVHVGFCVPK